MSTPVESRDVRNCRVFSRAASASAVSIGFLALLGWMLDIPVLTSVIPGLATMKPNTALCFALAGGALWLMQLRPGELNSPRVRLIRLARVLSGLVVLIGLLTLGEYLFHWNPGIDEFLFHRVLLATGVPHPGRMAGATTLGFVFLGASLLLISQTRPQLFQILALLATLDGCVACLGYLLDIRELYDIPTYASMALQTSLLFVAMGLAVLAARPRIGLMAEVTSDYVGGMMGRTVLPLVVMVPIFFGWLLWRGQAAGLYGTEFGIALRTMSEVATSGLLLWMSTVWLNRIDRDRRQTEGQKLRLAAIVESSNDAIFSKDLSGTILSWNQGAERLYGYSADEIVGQPVANLIPLELRPEATEFLEKIALGRLVTREETVRQRKDGCLVPVSLVISPVRDSEGKIAGASIIAHDISERKRAEELLRESERNYRTLFESMDEGFCIIEVQFDENNKAVDYRFLSVNPAFEKLTGIPDAQGKTMREIAPQHEEHWFSTFGKIALTGEPARFENFAAQLHRWYEVHAFRIGEPQESRVAIFFDDIGERKRAEEALRSSEEQFRTMANGIPQLAWMANADGWISWYNQGWYNYTGTTPRQIEGWGWQSVHDPAVLPEVMERWQASIATGEPFEMTFPLRSAQGEFRAFLTRVMPIKDASGKVLRWFGTNTDVEERQRAEEALRESEARLNDAQRTAHIGSWRYHPGANLVWSDEMYELFKLPRNSPVTYDAIVSVIHPEDRVGKYNRAFERALASTATDYREEYRVVWPDGQVRWMYSVGKIQRDAAGRLVEAVGTVQDVTEREHAEEALRQSSEDLRALTAHLRTVREEERKQMAREVHDDLGQKLTALRFDISALAKRLHKKDSGLSEKVTSARDMVDASILTVRQLAARLRPAVLDDLGLAAALTWEAERFEKHTGIACEVALEDVPVLGSDCATALFRIFQEVLTNVARHAQATHVKARLGVAESENVALQVSDNGIGATEAELSRPGHFGVMGIRERVLGERGSVRFHSRKGQGLTVIVSIPLGGKQGESERKSAHSSGG